jgi:hypothetical protein
MAPIPVTFRGTPNDLAAEMVRRMKIVSQSGTNFIFIGDTEPTSNVGPWLKDGTKWYVWDDSIKRYVPLDVSDSVTIPFFIGNTTPATSTPPVWLFTTKDASDVDPTYGTPLAWYVFNGTAWVPFVGVVASGPTASRPSGPVEYQQFYDTDIACLLWWERGQWRTVSGVPGDVKAVAFYSLTDALTHNPGWTVFGADNQAYRGRGIVQAAKDAGASPETTLNTDANVTQRAAFEVYGTETKLVVTTGASGFAYFPPSMALWHLVKL